MKTKSNPENKLLITVAICGSGTMKEQNPAIPYSPEEYGEEIKKCYEYGAAIVHIHARDSSKGGCPTKDLSIIKSIIKNIKSEAPEIIVE